MEKEKIISRLRGKLDEMHISYGDIDCYDGPTTVTVKVQFDGGDPVGNTLAGVEEELAHLQSSVFKLSKDLIDSIHEEGIVAYTS